MAVKVTIKRPAEILWPASCSKSLDRGKLVWVSATSGHVNTVRPTLTGSVKVDTSIVNVHYPVSTERAKGLEFANKLTRNTLGFKIMRGFAYFLGVQAASMLLLKLAVFLTGKSPHLDMPIAFAVMFGIGLIAMLMVIWAYRKQPVRIAKSTENTITLKFSNAEYAQKFIAANQENIVQ